MHYSMHELDREFMDRVSYKFALCDPYQILTSIDNKS